MVLDALTCGCFQGFSAQRSKSRAKHDLIDREAASCHDETVQARIKAFHEAKQRQEHEAKTLQELENAARMRAAVNSERLNCVELAGRTEKAKAEMKLKEQPEAAEKAVPQVKNEATSLEDVCRLPLEDSSSSLDHVWTESPCAAEMEATKQPEAAEEAVPQAKKEVTSPQDVRCLPLEDSSSTLGNARIESPCTPQMEATKQAEVTEDAALELKKECTSPQEVRCLHFEDSNVSLECARTESPYVAASDEHTPAVLQGAANRVRRIPLSREKHPGFEPATEAATLEESSGKSSTVERQLKSSELDGRSDGPAAAAAQGGGDFARKALLATCAVVVIATVGTAAVTAVTAQL